MMNVTRDQNKDLESEKGFWQEVGRVVESVVGIKHPEQSELLAVAPPVVPELV